MRERLVLLTGFLLLGAWHWARLERPAIPAQDLLLLAAFGVAAPLVWALGQRRIALLAVLPVALVAAIHQATGYLPWDRGEGFYGRRVVEAVADGARDWFSTRTPFSAGRFPTVDVELQLTFFAIALGLAFLLLCTRRPLLAVALAMLPVGLPSTVLVLDHPYFRATLFLALALGVLFLDGGGRRRPALVQAAALGATVVAAALVVGQAPGISKAAFLDWQNWRLVDPSEKRVSVGYVWDQTFGPLKWPKERTVVFEAFSPKPMYWKVATLDRFEDDRWVSDPQARFFGDGGQTLGLPDDLVPEAARQADAPDIVDVRFKILGLADRNLLSAGTPLSYEVPDDTTPRLNDDGTVTTEQDLPRDVEYEVRTYLGDPGPNELATAGTDYPAVVAKYLRVGDTVMPAFGEPRDPAAPSPLGPEYTQFDTLWDASEAAQQRTPFAAVTALEAYFRDPEEFDYNQTPTGYGQGAPLPTFLLARNGYCQMFSGAMALALRMHGIPARVAVGFTEGRKKGPEDADPYVVTDRAAHAWVEVYFPTYGWVPFDPTPTRALPTRSSLSNTDLTVADLQGFQQQVIGGKIQTKLAQQVAVAGRRPSPNQIQQRRLEGVAVGAGPGNIAQGGGVGAFEVDEGNGPRDFLGWIAVAAAILLGALVAAKALAVRWRYLRRGPRAQASAAYHEISTYIGDQGVDAGPELTFEELAAQVRKAFGVDASGLARVATVARYAPPDQAERINGHVRSEVREVKRALRGQLSKRDRVVGALRLRSALAQSTTLDD